MAIDPTQLEAAALETLQLEIRGWKDRKDEWPLVSETCRPSDYAHDLARGTVAYQPGWRNYSFHTVLLPAGAEIRDCNFTQALPDTPALQCDGTVTLIDCTLVNCRIEKWMTLDGCNTMQRYVKTDETADPIVVASTSTEVSDIQKVPPADALVVGADATDVAQKQAELAAALKG